MVMNSSAGFPIARVQLPKVSLSQLEQRAFQRMMTRMLHHTVQEFNRQDEVVDTSRWKAVGAKDDLQVYREREAGAMSAALTFALDKTDVLPPGSTVAPLTPPGVMMTGVTRGKVENAMDAVASNAQEDLALFLSFMHHGDVVDCAVLKTIEASTETDPFHFLGIKYFAQKAPPAGRKHRDSVYLEFTGYTETSRGERLGFHLMHSVELAEFPPLTARNSVRMLHSVRYLYRQQSEDVVEVFMQGNVYISGITVKPSASNGALFGLATLVACAEAKRLTQMWRAQQARNSRLDNCKQQARRVSMALECSMCRQKKKLFGGASLEACELCADVICTRCRSDKKVFEMDANMILGKFRKLAACKSCILEANRTLSQPHEPQMLIVMSEHLQLDREDRRRRGASSSGSSGTRSRSSSSCPLTPSEECSRASRLHGRGKNESVTSSASTVSSRSYQACQLVYTVNEEQMELQQQGQANSIKPSHRIQQFGSSQRAQQQLTPKPQAVVVSRSHRDYALRRVASTGSTFTCSSSRDRDAYSYATAPSSQPNDLFARMVELNRLAESTYNTTQQNGVYLSQQMRSQRRI